MKNILLNVISKYIIMNSRSFTNQSIIAINQESKLDISCESGQSSYGQFFPCG